MTEKSHRLELNAYSGFARATFTLCINGREEVFIDDKTVKEFVTILEECCKKYEVIDWIYIFMPDHLHLVLEGISETADIYKCVVLFKQKTGYYFSKQSGNTGWQKDFYDHIHRKDEDLKKHIRYIAENPVRRGLTARWEDYTYTGSVHYNLKVLSGGM